MWNYIFFSTIRNKRKNWLNFHQRMTNITYVGLRHTRPFRTQYCDEKELRYFDTFDPRVSMANKGKLFKNVTHLELLIVEKLTLAIRHLWLKIINLLQYIFRGHSNNTLIRDSILALFWPPPPPPCDIFIFLNHWFLGINCSEISNELETKYLLKPHLALWQKISYTKQLITVF